MVNLPSYNEVYKRVSKARSKSRNRELMERIGMSALGMIPWWLQYRREGQERADDLARRDRERAEDVGRTERWRVEDLARRTQERAEDATRADELWKRGRVPVGRGEMGLPEVQGPTPSGVPLSATEDQQTWVDPGDLWRMRYYQQGGSGGRAGAADPWGSLSETVRGKMAAGGMEGTIYNQLGHATRDEYLRRHALGEPPRTTSEARLGLAEVRQLIAGYEERKDEFDDLSSDDEAALQNLYEIRGRLISQVFPPEPPPDPTDADYDAALDQAVPAGVSPETWAAAQEQTGWEMSDIIAGLAAQQRGPSQPSSYNWSAAPAPASMPRPVTLPSRLPSQFQYGALPQTIEVNPRYSDYVGEKELRTFLRPYLGR